MAARNGKPIPDIVERVRQLGASARAKMVAQLTNTKADKDSWHANWFADDEATEATEDGPVPTTPDQWLEAVARPRHWADGRTLQELAEALNIEILVFQAEKKKKTWEKVAHLGQVEGRDKVLCPILLEDQHFMTLVPEKEKPWPEAWRMRPTKTAWTGRGGAGDTKAAGERTQDSPGATTSGWMRPASSPNTATGKRSSRAATKASGGVGKQTKSSGTTPTTRKRKGRKDAPAEWLKTASSPGTQHRGREAVLGTGRRQPRQKEPEQDAEEDVWTCQLCAWTARGRGKNLQDKVSNHLSRRHPEERKRKVEQNLATIQLMRRRELERTRSGLSTRLLLEPVHAADLPKEERAWTCWRCGLGLPELSRYHMQGSKRYHMKTAHGVGDLRKEYFNERKKDPEASLQQARKGIQASGKRRRRMDATTQAWQEWFPKHNIVELPLTSARRSSRAAEAKNASAASAGTRWATSTAWAASTAGATSLHRTQG